MPYQELHIPATAGWRALLTHAQHAAGVQLSPAVEGHLVSLLFRYVGADITPVDLENGLLDRLDRITNVDSSKASVVGDQCLLFAGLIPEHVIRKGLPVSYFVELGRNSYAEFSSRQRNELYDSLAREFVRAMDILQTLRVLQSGATCIDGLNAYTLWHELGSSHGWRVLRSLSTSLPASCSTSHMIH